MKRANRVLSLLVAMVLVIGMIGVEKVEAEPTKEFRVVGVNPTKSPLQKGDTFGLRVDIRQAGKKPAGDEPAEESDIRFDKADFSGTSQIDTGTTTGHVSLASGTSDNQIYIGGLTFLGGDGNINFTIDAIDALPQDVNVKLKVEQISDGQGVLKLKDTSQISLVAGESKKVDVLIENTGTSTVRNPALAVSLEGEKVEGITLKNPGNFKVSSIASKSSSRASFEIEASKVAKAGNYKLQFDLAGKTEIVSLRVTSDFMPPRLEFSLEGLGEIKPGTAQPIKIKVKNVGDSEAKQVKVQLENKEEMAIIGGSNVKFIPKIAAKQSGHADFTVRIAATGKQNILPIKITYSYQDEIGELIEDREQYIYIPLQGGMLANGEVLVQNIIAPGTTMGVGQNFNVKFTLAALKGNAKNIRISVAAENPEAVVPHSQNLFMLSDMKKGAKQQYTVTMSATPSAGSQSHPIKIEVSYDSLTGEEPITFKQYTSVDVYNPEPKEEENNPDTEKDTKKGQPKVIVGEYKVTPTIVKAGEDFQLDIGFLNTNSIKSVHNLKANLTIKEQGENDAGNVFTPVNASNTFYIASLSPGQMLDKRITMYTIPNALPKTYQVQLELEYEDSDGNQITATENIGIPVEQTTKIDIAEIEIDMLSVGMPMPINVSLYNTGKTNISNLMIFTEGQGFTVQDNKMFVGTFEKGASEYYSPTIIPEMPGLLIGTVVVQYEEANGEIVEIRKDFETEVMEMMDEFPDDMGDMPFEEEKNGPTPLTAAIIALLAVAAGVIFIIRKKKKQKEDFEIELDE